LNIFAIPSSTWNENCCRMFERIFCLFQCSRIRQSCFCKRRDLLFLIWIPIEIEQEICSRLLLSIENVHNFRNRQDIITLRNSDLKSRKTKSIFICSSLGTPFTFEADVRGDPSFNLLYKDLFIKNRRRTVASLLLFYFDFLWTSL
jgi:hypothetical protein